MSREPVYLAAVETAAPPFVIEQADAAERLLRYYDGQLRPASVAVLRRVFAHPSVVRRHFAIDSPDAYLTEDPDQRNERFTRWAVHLSAQAARGVLARLGAGPADVAALVVNTCTGYICPGVSTYLLEELGLPRDVRTFDLVGGGCGGAVPNLQLAEALLATEERRLVLSVSVEICSATMQMGDDASLLISNALFADGAAAAALWRRPQGLELVGSASRCWPEHRDEIRFVYRGGQLHNQLSPRLAQRVAETVPEFISGLLHAHHLRTDQIRHWALHAGGAKVLDALQTALRLPDERLTAARAVLAEYGNLSSASVWFTLNRLRDEGLAPGDWCMFASFGAGLSAHAYLIRVPGAAV